MSCAVTFVVCVIFSVAHLMKFSDNLSCCICDNRRKMKEEGESGRKKGKRKREGENERERGWGAEGTYRNIRGQGFIQRCVKHLCNNGTGEVENTSGYMFLIDIRMYTEILG